ncbi:MAG: FAD-binding protein [Candidatus Daviesbacteria bacterium]|nr:FAD-binding protein [Candidatus Daviesbacteria bacterium]
MEDKIKLLATSFGLDKVKFNEKVGNHLATGVGGPASLFAVVVSDRELIKIIDECRILKIPFLIVGTGSKMMLSESGFDGVVIKNRTQNIKITSIKGKVSKIGVGVESVLLETEGGVIIVKFVEFLKKQGLIYAEFVGLSGSIGGNIFINRTLQEKTESIKVLNLDGEVEIIPVTELNLRKHIVISVILKIKAQS